MDNSLVIRTCHLKSIGEVSLLRGMINFLDGDGQIFGYAILKIVYEVVDGLAGG